MWDVIAHGFRDELQKIAAEGTEGEDLSAWKEKLLPGDILLGYVRKPGVYAKAMNAINSHFQDGTKYPHAALYAGDGKVIDTHPVGGVHVDTLDQWGGEYAFRALRVKTDQAMRDQAVDYAKEQIGKPYSSLHAIRMAFPAITKEKKRERQKDLKSCICSQVIANAYHEVPFAKKRPIDFVLPVDFQKSPHTKMIGEYP